jgi:N-acetyl-anhydromuramyl-L-alanine amidase AmpD
MPCIVMTPTQRTPTQISLLLVLMIALFSGCASAPSGVPTKLPVAQHAPVGLRIEQGSDSLGSEARKLPVQALILHHTGGNLAGSYDVLQGRKSSHRVGIHYLVTDENPPRIIAMVPESKVAYHAGKSAWRQFDGLNQPSIGIEIINLDGNIHPYPVAQQELVAKLCADILRRHPSILPTEVLAHSDIAIGRKIDPGLFFPWADFAARGIGAWPLKADVDALVPSSAKVEAGEVRRLLLTYGYAVETGDAGLKLALEAFQRHFRARKVDGLADAETVAILRALVKRYRTGATAPSPAPVVSSPAKARKVKP